MYAGRPTRDLGYGEALSNPMENVAIEKPFGKILQALNAADQNNAAMSKFVNLLFPCWTGTLTCFMTNPGESLALAALKRNETVKMCKWLLDVDKNESALIGDLPEGVEKATLQYKAGARGTLTNNNIKKVLGILFILEIVDCE
jgi:hypothetical protein